VPQRVLGFLLIFRQWDPTLIFVMGAALALNIVLFRIFLKMPLSVLHCTLSLPAKTKVDWQVIAGPSLCSNPTF